MSDIDRGGVVAQFPVADLQIWDKLELVFEDRERSGRYHSRIEDLFDDRILISRPSLINGDTLFSVGSEFTAIFIKPDSAYSFHGSILKKHHGGIEAYWINAPEKIERNQRRRFYRIDTDATVNFILLDDYQRATKQTAILSDNPPTAESQVTKYGGFCLNASGNGILIRTHAEIEVGGRILVSLILPYFQRDLDLFGVVRRFETHRDGYYRYGVEFFSTEELQTFVEGRIIAGLPERFHKFNENQRTLLLNYIFARQVALKKKGLV